MKEVHTDFLTVSFVVRVRRTLAGGASMLGSVFVLIVLPLGIIGLAFLVYFLSGRKGREGRK